MKIKHFTYITIILAVFLTFGCSEEQVPSSETAQKAPSSSEAPSESPNMASKDKTFYMFNENKEMLTPQGYREWVFVGTQLTPSERGGGEDAVPQLHNVFMDPVSYEEYTKTGKFREGTMFVKELVSVGSNAAVSGNGFFAGEFVGLEVSIKDSKLYPDEPGNWAYFSFSNNHSLPYVKATGALPAEECNTCHKYSAEEDWVFSQYYVVLRAAKPNK